jgi:hypothetical protein
MAKVLFMDIQESGGEMWANSWRCLNCGNVFDPVVERNRRLHIQAALVSASVPANRDSEMVTVADDVDMDIAA